ncbi:hypothetical protein BY46_17360 [Escherichia coli O111:H8 str. F6627]|nr:hypothetical protein BY46_17360 [Escherichia coli O111:H8 str. F6627]
MTKAGSNAGFFTAAHVFLSSGTVIQILHTGLTAGSCKWHIFSKIAKVTFPRHVWHKQEPAVNPVCRICITVPDERKTCAAVKKPALLPALVIAVK